MAAALGLAGSGAAQAGTLPASRPGGMRTEILDLGPAVVQFALMSSVLADTDGGWYSGSHITNDESGYLYTMRGRNLVRINDHPRR